MPYRWKCNDGCKTNYHFLDNVASFIPKQLHKDLFKHIQMLYKFYCKRTAAQAAAEMDIHPKKVEKWFRFYRDCITDAELFFPNFEFDVDIALQFDESKLSAKQKYHEGRAKDSVWVLGGIQGRLGYVVLKVVNNNRDGPLLNSIIASVTAIGSTVITDGWRAYLGLSGMGYYHYNVNHSERFVDTMHGYHTQTIENLWMLIRHDLRAARGVRSKDLQKWLDVFAFRRNVGKENPKGIWMAMCCVIGAMQKFVARPA